MRRLIIAIALSLFGVGAFAQAPGVGGGMSPPTGASLGANTFTGTQTLPNGSAANPSLLFNNAGLFSPGGSQLGFETGGSQQAILGNSHICFFCSFPRDTAFTIKDVTNDANVLTIWNGTGGAGKYGAINFFDEAGIEHSADGYGTSTASSDYFYRIGYFELSDVASEGIPTGFELVCTTCNGDGTPSRYSFLQFTSASNGVTSLNGPNTGAFTHGTPYLTINGNKLSRSRADSTTVGGNAIGANAVDLQIVRGSASNVASGAQSAIPGGESNTASGADSFAMGFNVTASGGSSAALGSQGTASGSFSIVSGKQPTDRGRYATRCHGTGFFTNGSNIQECDQLLTNSTTNTSAARLTADGATAGSANCFNIPNNASYGLRIYLHARDKTTAGNDYDWSMSYGTLTRDANAASTAFTAGTVNIITRGTVTGASVSQTADTTNGCLNSTFTPPSGNTDTWDVVEVVSDVEVQ